jgi:hypothetical protein
MVTNAVEQLEEPSPDDSLPATRSRSPFEGLQVSLIRIWISILDSLANGSPLKVLMRALHAYSGKFSTGNGLTMGREQ